MQPDGIGLFKVYCAIMTAMYGFFCLVAVALPFVGEGALTGEDMITFGIVGMFCFPLMLMFAYAFFLPRAKWAWVFGICLIALGMTSCCFWPICIPLLIKWIDPATKAWFENSAPTTGHGHDGW